MGNTPSLEGEDKSKYIEEQKKIIREQQEQIQRLASIAGSNVNEGMQFNTPNTVNKPKINPYNELNIGRNYDENDIMNAISDFNFSFKFLSENELFVIAAKFIQQEKIIGWFQGRSEFGPRALVNRSILANPSSHSTKYILDHYMKCRDRYRPYAPVVIEERAHQYFDINDFSCPPGWISFRYSCFIRCCVHIWGN